MSHAVPSRRIPRALQEAPDAGHPGLPVSRSIGRSQGAGCNLVGARSITPVEAPGPADDGEREVRLNRNSSCQFRNHPLVLRDWKTLDHVALARPMNSRKNPKRGQAGDSASSGLAICADVPSDRPCVKTFTPPMATPTGIPAHCLTISFSADPLSLSYRRLNSGGPELRPRGRPHLVPSPQRPSEQTISPGRSHLPAMPQRSIHVSVDTYRRR